MVNSMVELREDDAAIRTEIDGLLSLFQNKMGKIIIMGRQRGEITTNLPASQIVATLIIARNGLYVGKDYSMSDKYLHDTADPLIELIRAR